MLVALYLRQIALNDEYFYLALAENIETIEKCDEKIGLWILRYFKQLLIQLLKHQAPKQNEEDAKTIVSFVKNTQLFDRISGILSRHGSSEEMINLCFDIVAFMKDY